MNKGKKSRASALTEMHFVSALPLKKAVGLLGKLSTPVMPVTLTEVTSDLWRFEMTYHDDEGEPALANVKGTLRRWEGTFTRLDCTGDVYREKSGGFLPVTRSSGQTTLAILIVGVVLLLVLSVTNNPFIILAAGSLISVLALAGTAGNLLQPKLEDEEADIVYFRERDLLLQTLIDEFMAAADVSIDGSGLKIKTENDFAAQVLRQRRKHAAKRA